MSLTRELRFNAAGDHGDDMPVLYVDQAPHVFCSWESPNRLLAVIPNQATGGATLKYRQQEKMFRVILPPVGQQGQWEAGDPLCLPPEYHGDVEKVALHYAPARLPALHVDGPDFRDEAGQRWIFQMLDGFCDLQRLRDEGADALRPVLQEAKDLGANGRRVFLAGSKSVNTLWEITPSASPEFLDRVGVLLDLYTEYGLYAELTHGDLQVVCPSEDAQFRYFSALYEFVRDRTNRFVEGANEMEKNGLLRAAVDRVNRSGVLSCVGSGLAGGPCPVPPYDYSGSHDTRSFPGVFLDAIPAWMQTGYPGYKGVGRQPVPLNEMTGAGEVTDGYRRSNDPRLFFEVGAITRANNGATGHSELGIRSQLLASSPIQYACMDALLRGTSGREWNG